MKIQQIYIPYQFIEVEIKQIKAYLKFSAT